MKRGWFLKGGTTKSHGCQGDWYVQLLWKHISQGRQPEEAQENSSQPRLVAERARATASWGSGWFHREAVTSQTYSPVTNTVQTYIYIRSRFLHLGWQKIQVILCQMNNFFEGQIQNILSVPLLPTSLASFFASLFIWSLGPWTSIGLTNRQHFCRNWIFVNLHLFIERGQRNTQTG